MLSRSNPALQEVMFVARVRLVVTPILIAVMVVAVLESSALFQAHSGELPDRVFERFPPPANVPRTP